MQKEQKPVWLEGMSETDLGFIRRFLLASGSLKQLAEDYGISYPTVRLKLDRLIDKIKLYESESKPDPFEMQLRAALIDTKIDQATFTELLTSYRQKSSSD
ncbi:MAG: DUF2089 family protein [Thermoguttaceae bacterium]